MTETDLIATPTRSSVPFWLGVVSISAALAALPWFASFAVERLFVEVLTLLAIALAWNLLAGYGGLIAVGMHVFVGIGSYALFFLSNMYQIAPWYMLPAAAVVTALFAAISAWPLFRLSGAYFAVGTWVIAEMMRILAQNTPWLGAGGGMPLETIAGFDRWTRNASVYWAAGAVGIGALIAARLILRSRLGLALMSMRDAETAALACGVPVTRAKFALWVICSTITGIAGAVAYMNTLQVTPDASFSLNWTAAAMFIVILGGVGTLEGPILGTVIYFTLREVFAGYGSWYFIGVGSLAIATMVLAPGGASSLIPERFRLDIFRIRRAKPGRSRSTLVAPPTRKSPSASAI
jgi:branched-chain amino acid transport system permease protein